MRRTLKELTPISIYSARFAFVCLIIVLAISLLGPCTKYAQLNQRRLRVGFAQIANEGPWRDTNTESIKTEARRRNVDLKFLESDNPALKGGEQQSGQKEALRSFIKERVDVIAFSPVVETGWDDVLNEAKEAGIPVILSDRGVSETDESLIATFIGSDFVEEGRRAGRWLVDEFEDTQGTVNVIEVEGTRDSAPAMQRHRGFCEILSRPEYQDRLRVVAWVLGNFNYDQAKAAMRAFLANNDHQPISAALEEAGFKPGTEIKVVSVDATDKGCNEIKKGRLNCAVECKPRLGPALFDAAQAAAKSMALPERIIISEGVYDKSNVDKCGNE